ncbi:MAG: carboxymuconolactone decarboxylase family protein [Chloroflexi bacterium]|nr:carboxymuconolactone decarboxylase family protein [Chloroflexota bacterium]
MTNFTIHTIKSAPEDARPILQFLQDNVGFVPNLAATMANNPLVLETYATLNGTFGRGTLSPVEREIVLMATSYDNQCTYCMAAHSTFAKVHGASDNELSAIRAGKVPGNPRLDALVTFTHQVVQLRGQVSAADIDAFLDAGFTKAQALEILIGVIQATLASLIHKMTGTPLDEAFQPLEWAKSA